MCEFSSSVLGHFKLLAIALELREQLSMIMSSDLHYRFEPQPIRDILRF